MTGVADSELDAAWVTIVGAMSGRTPVAVLLEGDAKRCLPVWRAAAATSGVDWCETTTDRSWAPFDLWTHLAETRSDGSHLARRLRFGPHQPPDPGCPLLPDPVGVHRAILDWVAAAAETPLVVVLDVGGTDDDSWSALDYVVRGLEAVPLAIVIESGSGLGSRGNHVVRALADDDLVICIAGVAVPSPAMRPPAPTTIEFGLACCRTGAVRTGGTVLAGALASAGGLGLAREVEATAWRHLAMAMLTRGQLGFASTAVAGALALEHEPATLRLLRRIDLLVGHARGDGVKLHQLGSSIASELTDGGPEGDEAGWLRLDRALVSSRGAPPEVHERDLRDVLDLQPDRVSPQCRAVAHLWLGAFLTLMDDVPGAVGHQGAGLALLDLLGEESRSLPSRARLAAALLGLGRWSEAAAHGTLAARLALRTRDHEVTAECLCLAARAHVALGRLSDAERLLDDVRALRVRVWSGERARHLRVHARGLLSLARGEVQAAEDAGLSLWSGLEEPEAAPPWSVRLRCEATFLLADVAAVRGDGRGRRDWVGRGVALVGRAAPEERPALAAAGRARLTGSPGGHRPRP